VTDFSSNYRTIVLIVVAIAVIIFVVSLLS